MTLSKMASNDDIGTMRAVIFHGPYNINIEERPIPKIQDPTDIVVKVEYAALCGRSTNVTMVNKLSELHMFRGLEPSETGFIMGHEFTGVVIETGSEVKTTKKGDLIVSPFTTSCGHCFYCRRCFSSRCERSLIFGSAGLDGGQAEYVRIPFADGTVVKAPKSVQDKFLVLMADVFPTGYFAASNAFKDFDNVKISELTVVLLGCGPVGLCALISAIEYGPSHMLAVDSVPARLELARSLGAEAWNFRTDKEGLYNRVKELTNGRGADVVIEVVGLSPALRTAFELLRPWGTISSVGVHNAEIPWTASEAYQKNLKLQMGRCPVRSIFPQALEMLKQKQHLLGFMVNKIMPLSQAKQGYELFERRKVQKVIFEVNR